MAGKDDELDRHERGILLALQADARLSVQELAERIGLSTSPTWRRLKALEARGYIRDYVARVDPAKVGFGQTVFAHVTLTKHDRADIDAFEDRIRARPEVLDFYSMTGAADYLLRIVIRDAAAYEAFLKDVVFTSPAVQHISSHFALREIKNSVAVPIA